MGARAWQRMRRKRRGPSLMSDVLKKSGMGKNVPPSPFPCLDLLPFAGIMVHLAVCVPTINSRSDNSNSESHVASDPTVLPDIMQCPSADSHAGLRDDLNRRDDWHSSWLMSKNRS